MLFVVCLLLRRCFSFFFFNDTATTEIYTLSLHDALPIWYRIRTWRVPGSTWMSEAPAFTASWSTAWAIRMIGPCTTSDSRSEEHTSELQSLAYLVCRLLLEKKK